MKILYLSLLYVAVSCVGVPDPPSLDILSATSVTITLLITVPSYTGGLPIRNYTIYESGIPKRTVVALGDRIEIVISDLGPRTPYSFAIRASNDIGIGEAAVVSIVTDGIFAFGNSCMDIQ